MDNVAGPSTADHFACLSAGPSARPSTGPSTGPTRRKKLTIESFLTAKHKSLMTLADRYSKTRGLTKRKLGEIRKARKTIEVMHPIIRRALESRIEISEKKKHRKHYSIKAKVTSLKILKCSRNSYNILSKIFGLPTRRNLQSFSNDVMIRPGECDPIFENMRERVSKFSDQERLCVLLFGEMELQPHLTYSTSRDFVDGFVDDGKHRSLKVANRVQVFMLRWIYRSWKQVVTHTFSQYPTNSITIAQNYKAIIQKATSIGLKIIASVCDHRPINVKAIKILIDQSKESMGSSSAEAGTISIGNSNTIIPLFNPPHLLLSIRNQFYKNDLLCPVNGRLVVAKWSHLYNIYLVPIEYIPHPAKYIVTPSHLFPKKKKKVSICSELFSFAMGTRAHQCAFLANNFQSDIVFGPEYVAVSNICYLIHELFDSFNGTIEDDEGDDNKKKKCTSMPCKQQMVWNKTLPILNEMTFADMARNKVLDKLMETIRGFMRVQKKLALLGESKCPTRSFNQDALENFFELMNDRRGTTTCFHFDRNLKTMVLNNFTSSHSKRFNFEADRCRGLLDSAEGLVFEKYDDYDEDVAFDEFDQWIPPALPSSFDPFKSLNFKVVKYVSKWINKCIIPVVSKKCNVCLSNFLHLEHTVGRCSARETLECCSEHFVSTLMSIVNLSHFILPLVIYKSQVFAKLKSFILSHVQIKFDSCAHLPAIQQSLFDPFFKLIIRQYVTRINNAISLQGVDITKLNFFKIANYTFNEDKGKPVRWTGGGSRLTFFDMFRMWKPNPRPKLNEDEKNKDEFVNRFKILGLNYESLSEPSLNSNKDSDYSTEESL